MITGSEARAAVHKVPKILHFSVRVRLSGGSASNEGYVEALGSDGQWGECVMTIGI